MCVGVQLTMNTAGCAGRNIHAGGQSSFCHELNIAWGTGGSAASRPYTRGRNLATSSSLRQQAHPSHLSHLRAGAGAGLSALVASTITSTDVVHDTLAVLQDRAFILSMLGGLSIMIAAH